MIEKMVPGRKLMPRRRDPAHRTTAAQLANSRLGCRARIFDDDDVIELLRAAIEREGNQGAFARRHQIERSYVNQILNRKKPVNSGVLNYWTSPSVRVCGARSRARPRVMKAGRFPPSLPPKADIACGIQSRF